MIIVEDEFQDRSCRMTVTCRSSVERLHMIAQNYSAEALVNILLGCRSADEATIALNALVDVLREQLDGMTTDTTDLATFHTIKFIIDVADALANHAHGAPTINRVAELRLRAERKAGEWLRKHLHE